MVSEDITILLLPYLIGTGKLNLTDYNLVKAVRWMVGHPDVVSNLGSICYLYARIDDVEFDSDSDNSSDDLSEENENRIFISYQKHMHLQHLLSFLPNLTSLILDLWPTDELMTVIGQCCKNLQCFQSHTLNRHNISDSSLAMLCHCSNLEIVRFINILPGSFDSDCSKTFSKAGFAMLILELSKLNRLECPEHLLRDAFQLIHEMKFNGILQLNFMKLHDVELPGSTVEIISRLCPYIAIFHISVNNNEENIIAEPLNRLICLQQLYLRLGIGVNIQLIGLKEFGHRLKLLSLIKYGFNESDLALINKHCFNLKILCLPRYNYDLDNADLYASLIDFNFIPKFRSLFGLKIDAKISGRLFAIMNRQMPYLRILYCTGATIDEFPAAVRDITDHGSWSHLEVLALPEESSYEDKFLICLLGSLKNLKKLAVDLPLSSQLTVMKFISEQSLSVRTCSYSDLPDMTYISYDII
ncbi:unnamed protein product [Rotaria magnacalcarata]|uniref:Uncharacterized protein n=1 Tax=Rotaria magnacalcarata TaxID=392030 RepID=A0A816Y180_9BILA|nr:unnamed protein product [Rotaria magnacalcarata]